MLVPFVDLQAQYRSIKSEIDAAIATVIAEAGFIKGKFLEKFENEFAAYQGRKFCVGCANGTDAIEIALRVLGVGAGDEVLVPANTWISTAEAVTTVGAKVVFVDSDPKLYSIDTSLLEAKITPRTKAIIPVHLYGLPAEMDQVMTLARKYRLKVIEDCAQSHAATYKGKLAGTFGDIATFSFFPGKNLGAYGDAGAIVCDDQELAQQCRMIGDHGRLGKFDHGLEGRNSRLDGLQAAILSAKLPYLDKWTELRRQHATFYNQILKEVVDQLPFAPAYSKHVYHLYVVQVPNRANVQSFLESEGVASGIHYPIALPLVQAYKYLGHKPEDFPVASKQMSRILSLPMYAELSEPQMQHIANALSACLGKKACVVDAGKVSVG